MLHIGDVKNWKVEGKGDGTNGLDDIQTQCLSKRIKRA